MPNTHSPPHKPLNYVLDDLPPSPAACPILGQELCRETGRLGQKREMKKRSDDRRERREKWRKGEEGRWNRLEKDWKRRSEIEK